MTICLHPGFQLAATSEENRPAPRGRSSPRAVAPTWVEGLGGPPLVPTAGLAGLGSERPRGRAGTHPPPTPSFTRASERPGTWMSGSWTREGATRGKFISRATPRNFEPAASSAQALIIQTSSSSSKTKQKLQTPAADCAQPTRRHAPGPAAGSALAPTPSSLSYRAERFWRTLRSNWARFFSNLLSSRRAGLGRWQGVARTSIGKSLPRVLAASVSTSVKGEQ